MADQDLAVVTCAVNGVLTDPQKHNVPVTPEEIAQSCREAYDAGASIMHVHFRRQEPGQGHIGSWDPDVAEAVSDAIRAACPGVIVNQTTGIMGEDVSGPLACLERIRPEMAACNAGSLNYLKTRKNGEWAWPPILFDNPVEKVYRMIDGIVGVGAVPEFECFDLGIVRSVGLYVENGKAPSPPYYNLVMGVASGQPADADYLPVVLKYLHPGSPWQVTAVGREDAWTLHQAAADLGGNLRVGLEDTFYLPDGERARGNGDLIESIVKCAERAGRRIASPAEARARYGMAPPAAA
jgi:uncharacterized protein (DUF849 family)